MLDYKVMRLDGDWLLETGRAGNADFGRSQADAWLGIRSILNDRHSMKAFRLLPFLDIIQLSKSDACLDFKKNVKHSGPVLLLPAT